MATEASPILFDPSDDAAASADVADTIPSCGEVASPTTRRALNDAPLRSKIVLVALLAAAGGAMIGGFQARSSVNLWPLVIGFTGLMAAIMWLCDWWLISPFERLLHQLDSIRLRTAPRAIHKLPATRRDEIGAIARTVQEITINGLRHEFEAKRVQRTMDAQIESQTRTATLHLRKIAMRDPLTDLANRRFLDEHFELLVAEARKAGQDLICVAIDLDNFKTVNDTLGHEAGDELLLFLSSILRGCIRCDDYAVRLGGDEFVLLLPGCTVDQARLVVDRIRSLFRGHVRNTLPAKLGADLSLGVASLRRDGAQTSQDLLKKADHYLYNAKHAGKGRAAGT